jgi:hypothetical protein
MSIAPAPYLEACLAVLYRAWRRGTAGTTKAEAMSVFLDADGTDSPSVRNPTAVDPRARRRHDDSPHSARERGARARRPAARRPPRPSPRFEQERVGFGQLERALRSVVSSHRLVQ